MKKIKITSAFIICLFTFQSFYSQENQNVSKDSIEDKKVELNWMPHYKRALKQSNEEKKPILIYFTGSDWCGPCKMLDKELFGSEKFKNLADEKLVILEVDIPRRLDLLEPKKMKENLTLQNKYKVKAFPTLMMVNHKGRKIAEKKGYVIIEYYYPFFDSALNKY